MIPILPTSYFGSIAYFKALAQYPEVMIEAKEHYPKQTYRNRCDIVGGDGIISLSIPVKRIDGAKTPTEIITVSDDENWRVRHWRTLVSAYQSSAYFDHYSMEVEELLFANTTSLLELNTIITKRVIEWLDIETKISHTTHFEPLLDNDYRITLTDKNHNQVRINAPYIQVFPSPNHFAESLSILDAIFCEGPMTHKLILE